MTIDTTQFKSKLLAEKQTLEKELSTVARRNPENPKDWEPISSERDADRPDPDERAEKLETFEENVAITRQLEGRYDEILAALQRIEDKSFGICSVCGNEIETDRLEANPAATTCKAHMN